MDRFRYRALAPGGEVVADVIDAADRDEVVAFLRSRDFLPISINPIVSDAAQDAAPQAGAEGGMPTARRATTRGPRLRRGEIILFTGEFETLLSSGFTVDQGLDALTRTSAKRSLAELAGALRDRVRSGRSLSAALEDYPETFDAFYIAMIRAGEAGGRLETTLAHLTRYLEQIDGLVRSVRSEMTYPAILAGATLVSLFLLFGFAIPQFEVLLRGAPSGLPGVLETIFALSGFLRHYGWILLGAVLLAGLTGYMALTRSQAGQRHVGRLVRHLPVVGPILFSHSLERFCRSAAALMESGVDLSRTLRLAADVCGNRAIVSAVAEAETAVKRGSSLTEAFRTTGIFPPLVVELVRVGEESGQLQATIARLADIYGREIRQSLNRVTSLIGPALVILVGLFVAIIAAALYTTILDLNLLTG